MQLIEYGAYMDDVRETGAKCSIMMGPGCQNIYQ